MTDTPAETDSSRSQRDAAHSTPILVLASASPRRRQLLREAGYEFTVQPAEIDEEKHPPGLLPVELARFLALEKARVVAAACPDRAVLAADTVVALGDRPLGKPADAAEARRMLTLLSGTTHIVITAVALLWRSAGIEQACTAMTAVRMRALTPREIDEYVASRLWEGKAGGYGIQDHDPFVTRMAGSHTNVVGLPMEITREMLSSAGIRPREG